MSRVQVEVILRGRIVVIPEYPGEEYDLRECLDTAFGAIMEDLLAQRADEPSVDGDLEDGDLEVSVLVTADSPGAALDVGSAIIRAALSVADVWTDTWEENKHHMLRTEICEIATVELVDA